MPYQIVPPLAIIALCFTGMGVGLGAANKYAYKGKQKKLQLLDQWDRNMDIRDRRLQQDAQAALVNRI